jgi:SAM-dependent methyltransferase
VDRRIVDGLIAFYDRDVERRDEAEYPEWKRLERQRFLGMLRREGARRLLEVGAGTGRDACFFREHGLEVVATDLTPAMVRRCREKGLDAHVMDLLQPDLPPGSFDAIHALSCLLHVTGRDLPRALEALHELLVPGGLLFLGTYGGQEREGLWPDGEGRFFAFHSDEFMERAVSRCFETASFTQVPLPDDEDSDFHFQALTLRRR